LFSNLPVYKLVENYYILYIKQKEKQTMSKTFFNISEQKQKVINFIKKHKDILRTDGSNDITAKFIDKLKKASNKEFLRLASDIRLKFGQNFYIFSDTVVETHRMIVIWLPNVLSEVVANKAIKITTDKAIKDFCGYNSFADVIETHSFWHNMTPKHWEMFEAVFDFYDKQKKTAKKIVKPKEVKLSDSARLNDDIVF
jgi:sulfur relay (sulfurtransferase) DsrC/TusE family protein